MRDAQKGQPYVWLLQHVRKAGAYFKPSKPNHVRNGFILGLIASGLRFYATYFGNDVGITTSINSISTDLNKGIYICGRGRYNTLLPFPLENPGGPDVHYYDDEDGQIFLTRFNADDQIVWSTFLMPEYNTGDAVVDVCTDTDDNTIVIGRISSESQGYLDFENQGSGYQDDSFNGGSSDAFIMKFNSSYELYWSTFLGGDGDDYPSAVITDDTNNINLCGYTNSSPGSFPLYDAGGNSYYDDVLVDYDGWIARFTESGTREWCSLFGGDDMTSRPKWTSPLEGSCMWLEKLKVRI